ncbi:ATP-grasp domain-containing protein [Lachnospiraceae bacterium]|nr:ATP-grasp domain-containing protein [Lachnospiraceae bacterium]
MLDDNLLGKKLLLIGGVGAMTDLIELAHRNGVFIGAADYNKGTRVKQIADASYEIDALDIDALAELCRKEHYEGVISNFSDMLSPYTAEVAKKIGAYTPYTVEQLRMSTDKKYFKEICVQYGIPVPKEYAIDSGDYAGEIKVSYPVIIKPVDGSGSKGITICKSQKELEEGIKKARTASRTGSVIVEDYIPYDEINVTYIAQEGDIQLAAIHDRYFNGSQEDVVPVPDMYIYPSRYTGMYYEKYNDKVIRMLKGIGVRNGSLFLQAVVKDNEIYFYEAGMRLNGCKTYHILEVENDYNTFEHLMNYALTGSMGRHGTFDARFKRWYATWNVVGIPGMICQEFVGRKEIETYPWLIKVCERYGEGEKIPESAKGTLIQLVARIHVYGDTKEQLLERIGRIQSIYRVKDPEGKDVLMKPHDINDLREKINYHL